MDSLFALPEAAFLSWYEAKLFLEHSTSVSPDALHVIAGALIFFICALLFRRPISDVRVWVALLCLNFFNEFVDLWAERWPDPAHQYGQGMKDLLLTMVVPTILVLVARFAPAIFSPAGPSSPEEMGD
ncbi:MAG TPA: hypothetical protein VFZ88_01910 [Sphingomicrobium sp.]